MRVTGVGATAVRRGQSSVVGVAESRRRRAGNWSTCRTTGWAGGRMPMLKALCAKTDKPGQSGLEARRGCGSGACMGCTIDTVNGPKRVCREGPVFGREEIKW